MNLLAVATAPSTTTAIDRLRAIPGDFWLRLAVAVLALVAIVFFLQKVAKMNRVVLVVVTGIIATVVGFNWIYERNEPVWARPAVSFLAGYFPTKGLPPKALSTPPAKMRP
jgi:hypothetical protein